MSTGGDPKIANRQAKVEELGDGWRLPMPPWDELEQQASLEGLGDDQLRLLRSKAVAQPFGTYTQPLRLENTVREDLPKVGILCSFSVDQVQEMIASDNPLTRGFVGPDWRFVDLPTGHWPMFSRPDDLAELLLDLVPSRDVAASGSWRWPKESL
jgi:hypothetical protein